MKKIKFKVDNIPAILWGEKSEKLVVAIHGNMSNKSDDVITLLAEEAVSREYQVLSFDLPKHGDRKDEPTLCKAKNCVEELKIVIDYAKTQANYLSLFACSLGAYFSLLALKQERIEQSFFLSPVVDMASIIENMMEWFDVSEEKLKVEKEVLTPIGEILYWDYYCYVKENPIVKWDSPTSILYGEKDNLTDFNTVSSFSNRFKCELDVLEGGEHFFHTSAHLSYFRQWLAKKFIISSLGVNT